MLHTFLHPTFGHVSLIKLINNYMILVGTLVEKNNFGGLEAYGGIILILSLNRNCTMT